MIVDSSALIAVVMQEPGSEGLVEKIKSGAPSGIAAPVLVESAMVLTRRLGGDPMPLLGELLEALDVEVVPFTAEHSRAAVAAFLRYGKGRHRAALNFGDCLSYALAAVTGQPLLYVGEDFSRTDVAGA